MISVNKMFCIGIVLLSFVYKSESVNCYSCNSASMSECTRNLTDEQRKLIPVVDCKTDKDVADRIRAVYPSSLLKPPLTYICRKHVEINHEEPDIEHVTRDCGWVRRDSQHNYGHIECSEVITTSRKVVSCQCFADLCNNDEIEPNKPTTCFYPKYQE